MTNLSISQNFEVPFLLYKQLGILQIETLTHLKRSGVCNLGTRQGETKEFSATEWDWFKTQGELTGIIKNGCLLIENQNKWYKLQKKAMKPQEWRGQHRDLGLWYTLSRCSKCFPWTLKIWCCFLCSWTAVLTAGLTSLHRFSRGQCSVGNGVMHTGIPLLLLRGFVLVDGSSVCPIRYSVTIFCCYCCCFGFW